MFHFLSAFIPKHLRYPKSCRKNRQVLSSGMFIWRLWRGHSIRNLGQETVEVDGGVARKSLFSCVFPWSDKPYSERQKSKYCNYSPFWGVLNFFSLFFSWCEQVWYFKLFRSLIYFRLTLENFWMGKNHPVCTCYHPGCKGKCCQVRLVQLGTPCHRT